MALVAAELRRRLTSPDYAPPEKRLRLAVRVFESPHLQVARKEEPALEALCQLECWDGLGECLRSERFARTVLHPGVRKKLVQTCAKNAECGRLLLSDPQTANYLAGRPQEFRKLCAALFANRPDLATLRAAVACARRSPAPMSLAPFVTALSSSQLDEESVRLVSSVVTDGTEIQEHLKVPISPETAELASRIVAAKFGRSDSQTETFVKNLTKQLSNGDAISRALSSLESVDDRQWLVELFDRVLAEKDKSTMLAAFRPLPRLDMLLFESLLPKLVSLWAGQDDLDDLLVDGLLYAEKEQRAHKLIPKFLEGVRKDVRPKMDKFLAALTVSALKWPSKHISSAISGLLYNLEHIDDGTSLAVAAPLLCQLLEASKAAQHNMPDHVREKTIKLLEQLAKVLENLVPRMEKLAVKKKDQSANLASFLSLCVRYGELSLLITYYAEDPEERSLGQDELLDFSLLLPFVKNWKALADAAFMVETCRPHIVSLVDQKIRAATLLGLDVSSEQKEAAALMLASSNTSQCSVSLDLLLEGLDKATVAQVADSLAAGLLQTGERKFSFKLDENVALALLRAMKEQDMARGVLGKLKLKKAPAELVDPFSSPDAAPGEHLMQFVRALGVLRLEDEEICRLGCAALISACHGVHEGWNVIAPVLASLLSKSNRGIDAGRTLKWLATAETDLDESSATMLVEGLFGDKNPRDSDLQVLKSSDNKALTLAVCKHFLKKKLSKEATSVIHQLADRHNVPLPLDKAPLEKVLLDLQLASCEQLTKLFRGKSVVDSLMADAALSRLLQFDLSDVVALKQVAVCLNAFLTSRTSLAMDRLPVVQQRLQLVLAAVVEVPDEEAAADVAHLVEGMGVAMFRQRKDVMRVAPYFAADVLALFESKPIKPAVKVHIERYLQALLRLSDEHGDLFLLRNVSPACQQILHAQLAEKKKIEKYV